MNAYSTVVNYLKKLGDENAYINTITLGYQGTIDNDKHNIFPLLDIVINTGSFPSEGVVRFDIELIAVDRRDVNKLTEPDKLYQNDNAVDNHNEMLDVLQEIWRKMRKDFEDNNITSSELPTFNKVENAFVNLVDGWMLSFYVDIPNNTALC